MFSWSDQSQKQHKASTATVNNQSLQIKASSAVFVNHLLSRIPVGLSREVSITDVVTTNFGVGRLCGALALHSNLPRFVLWVPDGWIFTKPLLTIQLTLPNATLMKGFQTFKKNITLNNTFLLHKKKKEKEKKGKILSAVQFFSSSNCLTPSKHKKSNKNKKTPGNHVKAAFSPRTHLSITVSVDALCK